MSTIHLLTPAADLRHVRVACGTDTPDRATWLLPDVTCARCKATRALLGQAQVRLCTCRPGLDLCPVCRAWQRTHTPGACPGAPSRGSRRAIPRTVPALEPHPVTTEKALQEEIRQLALAGNWRYYHTHDARHSPAGFVDTVLVRGPRLVCAELKMPGKTPTAAQQQWLEALAQVTGPPEVYLWTPADLARALEVLR